MFGFRIFAIIPEKSKYIVERFGKFHTVLNPGINFLVPILDRIAYRHSLKEEAISIEKQQAITKDNVTIAIDGVLFIQVDDPYKASYTVEHPFEAVRLLCLTILRSEIGKMKLDELLQERGELNKSLYKGVNIAAEGWGLKCNSVEILQIDPPQEIKVSMQYEAEAERLKRRDVLKSEGQKLAEINVSKGQKTALILQAEGDAESVKLRSEAESSAIKQISQALQKASETRVVDYILLSNYLRGYSKLLQKSNVVVVPQGQAQGAGGGNNDLLSLAGMMLFRTNSVNQQPIDQLEVKQVQNQPAQTNEFRSPSSSQQEEKPKDSNKALIENLIKKNNYYDDLSFYSSGDEKVIKPEQRQRKSII